MKQALAAYTHKRELKQQLKALWIAYLRKMSKMFGRVYASSNSMAFPWIPSTRSKRSRVTSPVSMWTVRRAIPSISLFLDLLNVAYYYNTELSTSNQGYRKPDFILKDQILWEHLEKLQKIKIGLFHDKNPSPRYAEPHIPGKGIFLCSCFGKV